MIVKSFDSAESFLNIFENVLNENESYNNRVLGYIYALKGKQLNESFILGITDEVGHPLVGACYTPKDGFLSYSFADSDQVKMLAQFIKSTGRELSGVIGNVESVEVFAKTYLENENYKVDMRLGVYELEKLIMPSNDQFKMILATNEHSKKLEEFCLGFIVDCFGEDEHSLNRASSLANRHIEQKDLYFLIDENNSILAMASNIRETKNTGSISLVYTPPAHRGRGYGSLVTALVSQKVLNSGKKYCNLFTNLENSTSNSIYQSIGYQKIGESISIRFNLD